ncbi:hypothetical protein BGW80DRAFT_1329681 [Lactifluus volemus]|nr:hypothetical protein BGW80DRAFT_1329681 [Lactifluus volemus]
MLLRDTGIQINADGSLSILSTSHIASTCRYNRSPPAATSLQQLSAAPCVLTYDNQDNAFHDFDHNIGRFTKRIITLLLHVFTNQRRRCVLWTASDTGSFQETFSSPSAKHCGRFVGTQKTFQDMKKTEKRGGGRHKAYGLGCLEVVMRRDHTGIREGLACGDGSAHCISL